MTNAIFTSKIGVLRKCVTIVGGPTELDKRRTLQDDALERDATDPLP